MTRHIAAIAGLLIALAAAPAAADGLAGERLVAELRDGGYTIYFRHAATDWGQGDDVARAGDWTSCDPQQMRQLSDAGRADARRLGAAMRTLALPVGEVLSSPYCRAAETARLMDMGPVETTRDIMNTRAAQYVGGRDAVVRRVRAVLADPPPEGGNRVIVGHGNLMRASTGVHPSEGGAVIFRPDAAAEHGYELVARVSGQDWQTLAARFGREAGG